MTRDDERRSSSALLRRTCAIVSAVSLLTETFDIDHPAAVVWAVLVDFPNVPTWENGVLEVRQTSPGTPGVGTTFVARRSYGGRVANVDCRITDWQEGRSATMQLLSGPTSGSWSCYAVEPLGNDASRVTFSADFALPPLVRPLTPLVALMGRRLVRGNLRRLADRVQVIAASAG